MDSIAFRDQFTDTKDACALAQAIVDTVREPVLVLDKDLRVIAASRSFYSAFKVSPEITQGRHLYALGDGQWDIPKLREQLETVIPRHGVIEGYEVEHEFPSWEAQDTFERAPGVLRGWCQYDHSAWHGRRHRPAPPGAREGRTVAPKGHAAR